MTTNSSYASSTTLVERAHNIRRHALRMGQVQGQGYVGQASAPLTFWRSPTFMP